MSNEEKRRGLMLALSSPSGAGKSTLAKLLIERDPAMRLSVSATTRAPRPDEQDGREYHFMSRADFEAMASRGEFLEWALVFDNFYGTPRKPVEEALAAGRDVLFDVDWQGARALRAAAPEDVVGVFILPPSRADLETRLRKRAADSEEVIQKRMARSAGEISHWTEYEYVLVNRDVEETYARLAAILAAERLKAHRQTDLAAFAAGLSRNDP
ncbi:MAG: guanylate kinase [Hydrogenophilaceae bacterium]|jgi:guanylate kinase|nr:guanylate kinase [Hydrogenophilaceae bacterium]